MSRPGRSEPPAGSSGRHGPGAPYLGGGEVPLELASEAVCHTVLSIQSTLDVAFSFPNQANMVRIIVDVLNDPLDLV